MDSLLASLLSKLDLSAKEQLFLKTAFSLQQPTLNEIIKKSGLKKPTAYKILDNLVAAHLMQKMPRRYRAILVPPSPERLLEFAKRKTRIAKKTEVEIEGSLQELRKLFHSQDVLPEIKVVYGAEGYIEISEKTLEEPNTEVKFIGSIDELHHVITSEYDYTRYIPERIKKNIRARAILVNTPTAREFVKRDKQERRETKLLPDGYQAKAIMLLWKDQTLIYSGSKEGVALYISSPLIASLYHELFDLLWERLD